MSTSTLTSEPVAGVLRRLHADAARTQAEMRRRKHAPKTDTEPGSAEFWAGFRDVHFAVSAETGELLYLLSRMTEAQSIVEFGTSFGVSTLYLASALRDNGGGQLVGSEFETGKAAAARDTLAAAGLDDLVDIRVGDAVVTLRSELPTPIDLVLLDGTKTMYLSVLQMLEPHLSPRAVIVADNASKSPEYLAYVRAGGHYLSIVGPGRDVEISLRTAAA